MNLTGKNLYNKNNPNRLIISIRVYCSPLGETAENLIWLFSGNKEME
jgi:hypothetical protein